MYRFSYAEVLKETPQTARERERVAIEHSIELLKAAAEKGIASRECIEDLAKPENDLPKALRADLISVGLWIMRESEQVRLGESVNFKGLIEVSQLIAEGLR
jgi:flagellar biosynthesis activator protein FlaF